MIKEESQSYGFSYKRRTGLKSRNISRIGLAIETGLLAAVIVVFNLLALDLGPFGFVTSASEPNLFVPLVAPGIQPLVPWFNLWWSLALIVNLTNIYRGSWHPMTRIADFGAGIIGLCVLTAALLLRPALALEPVWAAEQLAAGTSLEVIEHTLLPLINICLLVATIVAAVSLAGVTIGKGLYLLRTWRPDHSEIRSSIHIIIGLAIAFSVCSSLALFFGEIIYLVFGVPLGLLLGIFISKQFSASRMRS